MNAIEQAVEAKQRHDEAERRRQQLNDKVQRSTISRYTEGFSASFSRWIRQLAADLAREHNIDVTITHIDGVQQVEVEHVDDEPCSGCEYGAERTFLPSGREVQGRVRAPTCQAPISQSCNLLGRQYFPSYLETWGLKLGGDPDKLFEEPQFWFSPLRFSGAELEEALHHFDATPGYQQLPEGYVVVNVTKSEIAGRIDWHKYSELTGGADPDGEFVNCCSHMHGTDGKCNAINVGILTSPPISNFVFGQDSRDACTRQAIAVLKGERPASQFDYLRRDALRAAEEQQRLAHQQQAEAEAAAERRIAAAAHAHTESRRRTADRIGTLGPYAFAGIGLLIGSASQHGTINTVLWVIIGFVVGKVASSIVARVVHST